jgi:ADP-ribose pyrophosphatase
MARELIYTGRKIKVYVERATASDGSPIRWDFIEHPGAVAILPLVDAERVCLLRNRRPNVGETLLEIPAGTLEPGEAPEPAAIRELAEETGYAANQWRKLCECYPSPGVLNERMYLFAASDLTPGPLHLEKDEELVPEIVTWPQALTWALDGTIRDAKTLVAVLLWDRLRPQQRLTNK